MLCLSQEEFRQVYIEGAPAARAGRESCRRGSSISMPFMTIASCSVSTPKPAELQIDVPVSRQESSDILPPGTDHVISLAAAINTQLHLSSVHQNVSIDQLHG